MKTLLSALSLLVSLIVLCSGVAFSQNVDVSTYVGKTWSGTWVTAQLLFNSQVTVKITGTDGDRLKGDYTTVSNIGSNRKPSTYSFTATVVDNPAGGLRFIFHSDRVNADFECTEESDGSLRVKKTAGRSYWISEKLPLVD